MKIDIVREVAKSFLWLDLEPNEEFPWVVMHPIFESNALMNKKGELFDAFEDPDRLYDLRKDYEQDFLKTNDINTFLCRFIRKNYILTFLNFIYKYGGLTLEECGHYLIQHWCRIEIIGKDVNVSKSTIRKWLLNANKKESMEEEEYKRYSKLDDIVTIYRGVRTNEKDAILGFSWTLNKDTAEFFANRYDSDGYVYKAKIKKEDIFFTEFGRNEQEVVVDYTKLMNLELCKD